MHHWWDITISATRPIIKPIHVSFSIDCYTYWNFYILYYFSCFIHVTLRHAQNLIYVAYIFGRFKLLILLEADVSSTSVSQINAIT